MVSATVIGGLGLAGSWIVAGQLLAPHPRSAGTPPEGLNAETVSFASGSGAQISGWSISAEHSQGVIVLVHGIRESRSSMLDRAHLLHRAGYSVLTIDLQAHGESTGDRITVGHLEKHDVRAAVEAARNLHPGQPIGVIGVSLGGAAALLASPLGIDALVLESVYPNIEDAIQNRVEARLGALAAIPTEILVLQLRMRLDISPDDLRPIDHIGDCGCPVFLISGTNDRHTTAEETREMFSAARQPKQLWLVDGAEHEDLQSHTPRSYEAKLMEFLDQHLQTGDRGV